MHLHNPQRGQKSIACSSSLSCQRRNAAAAERTPRALPWPPPRGRSIRGIPACPPPRRRRTLVISLCHFLLEIRPAIFQVMTLQFQASRVDPLKMQCKLNWCAVQIPWTHRLRADGTGASGDCLIGPLQADTTMDPSKCKQSCVEGLRRAFGWTAAAAARL